MRRRAALLAVGPARAVCLALAACSAVATDAGAAPVYRRSVVLEDVVGRVVVTRTFGVRLPVPVRCGEGEPCTDSAVYDVVRLDFVEVFRERSGDRRTTRETDRGSLLLAVAYEPDDRATFEREIEDRLAELTAEVFQFPFAGWAANKVPLELSRRAVLPTYVCTDDGTERFGMHEYYRRVQKDKLVGIGGRSVQEQVTTCPEMRRASKGLPRSVETPPSVRRTEEITVEHAFTDRLRPDPEALAPRPRTVQAMRRAIRPGMSAAIFPDPATGPHTTTTWGAWGDKGFRFDARIEATSLPLPVLDGASSLHRWTVHRVIRTFGPGPVDQPAAPRRFAVAYVATVPPETRSDSIEEASTFRREPASFEGAQPVAATAAPAFDVAALVSAVVQRLERQPEAGLEELLAKVAGEPPAGPSGEPLWLAAVCEGEGERLYVIPTGAHAPLVNGRQFCDAVDALLP